MAQPPQSQRILIVEDELLIAMLLESMVGDIGYQVVATVGREKDAVDTIHGGAVDLAILDVNLGGGRSYGIANALVDRNIPFVFLTGYGEGALEEPYRGRPILRKPFRKDELEQALANISASITPQ
jgi:CheY-like chemotaxis protein